MFSLLDVWRPVQHEVKSLLYEYLAEDDEDDQISAAFGGGSGGSGGKKGSKSALRNPIVSINEVLRLAKPRDNTKVSCDE